MDWRTSTNWIKPSQNQTNEGKTTRTHLLVAQVKELVKLNPTVGERTERPLLLELGGEGGVGNLGIGLRKPHKNGPSAFRSVLEWVEGVRCPQRRGLTILR